MEARKQFLSTILPIKQYFLEQKLRNKSEIKVVFLVAFDSVWKYEYLYRLMLEDHRFHPILCIVPYTANGEGAMFENLDKTYNYFKNRNYNVVNTYRGNGIWLNIKNELLPDIVFFTVPYDYTFSQYRISNFLDTLTCYVPYAFVVISELGFHYSSVFYTSLWRYFCETDYHLKVGKSIMSNNGKNLYVTGYPTFDMLKPKIQTTKPKDKKVVVWAPHHTISSAGSGLNYSCFEDFAFFFLELANKYSDLISFVLKPHPLLKQKLYEHDDWGKLKTDLYYEKWTTIHNCNIQEGDYIELFLNSDALIHDSASFMAEYLITEKPAAFIYRDSEISSRINDFGNQLLSLHYKIETRDDIDVFLQNVVLENNDCRKEERIEKLTKFLKESYTNSPSQTIFNEIKKKLC